jgi:hypothetical protein
VTTDLFINENQTETRTIPAQPGLHPDLTLVYRPALGLERIAYRAKGASPDPNVLNQHEVDLVAKYAVSINGQELRDKDRVARLKPVIRQYLVDLILGYAAADEGRDPRAAAPPGI